MQRFVLLQLFRILPQPGEDAMRRRRGRGLARRRGIRLQQRLVWLVARLDGIDRLEHRDMRERHDAGTGRSRSAHVVRGSGAFFTPIADDACPDRQGASNSKHGSKGPRDAVHGNPLSSRSRTAMAYATLRSRVLQSLRLAWLDRPGLLLLFECRADS